MSKVWMVSVFDEMAGEFVPMPVRFESAATAEEAAVAFAVSHGVPAMFEPMSKAEARRVINAIVQQERDLDGPDEQRAWYDTSAELD